MPLVSMPNGEVVDVPDDISEEALNRIRSQYKQTRQQARNQGKPRRQLSEEGREVQRRADFKEKHMWSDNAATRGADRGLLFNLNDEISGGVNAAVFGTIDAIRHGDISRIGRRYRITRDTERELDRRAKQRAPITSMASEITGALVNPLGTGQKILSGAGAAAKAVGAERAAAALGNASGRVEALGAVPRAILAGGNQGALNAAGASENLSDVPGAMVEGFGLGAFTGGTLGTGFHLGARGAQIIRDALPKNATRTAYARIAQLLESGGLTPKQALRDLQVTNARGGDAMVQDLTPGLRAQAAAVSRRPAVPSSNRLIERGEERIQGRRDRFGQEVRDAAEVPPAGSDAFARAEQLRLQRRGTGQRDYAEGGTMDAPIKWSDDLDRFFKESPDADDLVRSAYTTAERFGQPIARAEGNQVIPSMRAFDYLKREFDARIGMAMRAGNETLAAGMSNQLNRLKGILADANPDYGRVLAAQRDMFQQENALAIGRDVIKRIGNNPRQVLADLNALPANAKTDARVGIIDALVNLDNKADPVAFFRTVSRNEPQRRVLEFAFGGKKEFRRFQRWVDREVRSTRADVLTAPGRQSETSRIAMADDEAHGGIGNVLTNAMRGYAFGGAVGLGSGVVRTLQNIASGTSRFAQEEIAKILLSKGDDGLVRGVEQVKRYKRSRDRSNQRRAELAGKAGQQIYTDELGS